MENVVEVGGYVLEPGSPAGTLLRRDEAAEGSVESLKRAFDEGSKASDAEAAPALATEVDEAGEATAKIERAVALCKGIGEGQALNPTQLGLEVGALLDCLERLDRKKEYKKALQMARALATLLMLLKRWMDLLQTLRSALRAGEQLDDLEAVAWAKHELGTLRLAAGDIEGADRNLQQAREIRERIGDRRGLATTERNMGALCDRVRSMLRDEKLVRPRARRGRSPALRLLALAAVLAAFGVGFAIGMAGGEDSGKGTVTERAAGETKPSPPGEPQPEPEPEPKREPEPAPEPEPEPVPEPEPEPEPEEEKFREPG
ncbi:MAG: Procyclic acidic repetitive protein [Solirubrobacterales bacterium]|jgi:tetratricopeptide (TPR) repeat protein|nr:Procyclic acidic repetitive protein [Solirubrobacterales bacterium]